MKRKRVHQLPVKNWCLNGPYRSNQHLHEQPANLAREPTDQ